MTLDELVAVALEAWEAESHKAERENRAVRGIDLWPAAVSAVRDAVLEEAAGVCDELRRPAGWSAENGDWIDGTDDCAKAIRAMKVKR